jgi:hypothetical protein
MKNTEQIQHAELRVQQLKYAYVNCHPTMKGYYGKQYDAWQKHLQDLKN